MDLLWVSGMGCGVIPILDVFGLPTTTFVMAVATVLAGSLGAIHYVVVHTIMGKPFPGEEAAE